jgi:hypothetical protein
MRRILKREDPKQGNHLVMAAVDAAAFEIGRRV